MYVNLYVNLYSKFGSYLLCINIYIYITTKNAIFRHSACWNKDNYNKTVLLNEKNVCMFMLIAAISVYERIFINNIQKIVVHYIAYIIGFFIVHTYAHISLLFSPFNFESCSSLYKYLTQNKWNDRLNILTYTRRTEMSVVPVFKQ